LLTASGWSFKTYSSRFSINSIFCLSTCCISSTKNASLTQKEHHTPRDVRQDSPKTDEKFHWYTFIVFSQPCQETTHSMHSNYYWRTHFHYIYTLSRQHVRKNSTCTFTLLFAQLLHPLCKWICCSSHF
jgi:hypothetical protein